MACRMMRSQPGTLPGPRPALYDWEEGVAQPDAVGDAASELVAPQVGRLKTGDAAQRGRYFPSQVVASQVQLDHPAALGSDPGPLGRGAAAKPVGVVYPVCPAGGPVEGLQPALVHQVVRDGRGGLGRTRAGGPVLCRLLRPQAGSVYNLPVGQGAGLAEESHVSLERHEVRDGVVQHQGPRHCLSSIGQVQPDTAAFQEYLSIEYAAPQLIPEVYRGKSDRPLLEPVDSHVVARWVRTALIGIQLD